MTKFNGGCSCGKTRFSANADPTFVLVCHCKACQKSSGSAFAVIVAFHASALTVIGEITTYDSKGDSGLAKHYRFCPSCGSPVYSSVDAIPNMSMVRAGSLDDPSWVTPGMEIQCDDKQPWVALGGTLKTFAKNPA